MLEHRGAGIKKKEVMASKFNLQKTLPALVIIFILLLVPFFRAWKDARVCEFSGITMGTYYRVQLVGCRLSKMEMATLKYDIDGILAQVNKEMSDYDPQSEISLFNKSLTSVPFNVSSGFVKVVSFALMVAEKSRGAFDPTVGPLVDLWGFGSGVGSEGVPSVAEIQKRKDQIGYTHLSVRNGEIQKDIPGLRLALGAIAKGYGVDCVADLLRERGMENFLVDIGGELVASGHNSRGLPWHISVEVPTPGAGVGDGSYEIIDLSGCAIATSGDYRNYRMEQTKTYSHIIDPRTGWPISNMVASVSVIAGDCMTADALATALMVMGAEEGMGLLSQFPETEAMFIIHDGEGYVDRRSPGFHKYLSVR